MKAIRTEYGATPFANGCLLARRLVNAAFDTIHINYDATALAKSGTTIKDINKNLSANNRLHRY